MKFNRQVAQEDFIGVQNIYDQAMPENVIIHDIIYPHVFGSEQYIGQFSDNTADELVTMGKIMDLPPTSSVLDIGCGRGRVAAFMAQNFDWEVTGIDLSEIPIAQAIEKHKNNKKLHLNFLHGDIYKRSFHIEFDGIYGTGAFCHFDADKLFRHCRSLLKLSGRIAFMERVRLGEINLNEDWTHLTTDWCCPYVYSTHEYITLLTEAGFKIVRTIDLTPRFRIWQERSVKVRENLREEIINRSSLQYFQTSLNFAKYENNVTQAGYLGYVCMIAERI